MICGGQGSAGGTVTAFTPGGEVKYTLKQVANPLGVAVNGDRLAVADYDAGKVRFFDIRNPAAPVAKQAARPGRRALWSGGRRPLLVPERDSTIRPAKSSWIWTRPDAWRCWTAAAGRWSLPPTAPTCTWATRSSATRPSGPASPARKTFRGSSIPRRGSPGPSMPATALGGRRPTGGGPNSGRAAIPRVGFFKYQGQRLRRHALYDRGREPKTQRLPDPPLRQLCRQDRRLLLRRQRRPGGGSR